MQKRGLGEASPPPGFCRLEVSGGVNFTPEVLERNITAAAKRNPRYFSREIPRHEPLVIVGNGPSLRHEIHDIKKRQQQGAKLICVNGAHDWLIERDVIPWAAAFMDVDPLVADFVRSPRHDIVYFVASQCDPVVFDALDGCDVVVWHCWEGMGEESVVRREMDARGIPWALIPGGPSVGLRCINLGAIMGWRELHVYALDCCFEGRRQHTNQQGSEYDKHLIVHVNGREFQTAVGLVRQARAFEGYVNEWNDCFPGVDLWLHGGGLITAMMQDRQKKIQARHAAAPTTPIA
jgi:hypothetical protein